MHFLWDFEGKNGSINPSLKSNQIKPTKLAKVSWAKLNGYVLDSVLYQPVNFVLVAITCGFHFTSNT